MSYHFTEGSFRLPEPSLAQRTVQNGSKGHFTGQATIGAGPGRLTLLESHFEFKGLLVLTARPTTAELFEQVAYPWMDANKEWHTHYADFVVLQTDGCRVGYAVRPMCYVTDEYRDELGRVKFQALKTGTLSDFRLLTEEDFDPVTLFNGKLFHSVRRPDPEADTAAREVVSAMTGIVSLGEMTDRIGREGAGYRALIRLIRDGVLQPLHPGRLLKSVHLIKREAV